MEVVLVVPGMDTFRDPELLFRKTFKITIFLPARNEKTVQLCSSLPLRVRQFCKLQEKGQSLMRAAMTQLNLSARAHHRTRSVKLARMIADPAGREEIQSTHLREELQYCPKIMM